MMSRTQNLSRCTSSHHLFKQSKSKRSTTAAPYFHPRELLRRRTISTGVRRFSTTAATLDAANANLVPVIVSRRALLEYLKKHKTKEEVKAPPGDAPGTPWGKNAKYSAAVAAAVLIPYFTAWLITSNEFLRERLLKYLPAEERLRRHFGEADLLAVSYPDVVASHR